MPPDDQSLRAELLRLAVSSGASDPVDQASAFLAFVSGRAEKPAKPAKTRDPGDSIISRHDRIAAENAALQPMLDDGLLVTEAAARLGLPASTVWGRIGRGDLSKKKNPQQQEHCRMMAITRHERRQAAR